MIKRPELLPNHRWFELADGRKIGAHKNSCLFCKHNTDIFYDYTHGIYMLICEFGSDDEKFVVENVEKSFEGQCPEWVGK